jgi:DNA-binding LytR/AlgR family response regulator
MSAASKPNFATICPGQSLRAGMRVVVVERDAAIRESVAHAFARDAAFVVVGVTERMTEANEMIDQFVPEVVICPAEQVVSPPLSHSEMLLLHTSSTSGEIVLWRADAEGSFSLRRDHLARSLEAIKGEILFRKGEWLCHLIASASSTPKARSDEASQIRSTLTAPRRGDVVWVRADGNYVLFHGNAGTWKERGTLSMLRGTNSNCKFLRISRSCAVNCSQIERILKQDNHLVISMKCGTVLRPSRSYLRLILEAVPELIQSRSVSRAHTAVAARLPNVAS